jgi:transposase
VGIDATTLEANGALRSIVRRATGESYEAFLMRLAKASGIATATREELARLDASRPTRARTTTGPIRMIRMHALPR